MFSNLIYSAIKSLTALQSAFPKGSRAARQLYLRGEKSFDIARLQIYEEKRILSHFSAKCEAIDIL